MEKSAPKIIPLPQSPKGAGDAADSLRHVKLLDLLRNAIRVRHYSRTTESSYVGWIRRFVLYHGKRHPLELGEPEITQFLTHLAVQQRVSASTQKCVAIPVSRGLGT